MAWCPKYLISEMQFEDQDSGLPPLRPRPRSSAPFSKPRGLQTCLLDSPLCALHMNALPSLAPAHSSCIPLCGLLFPLPSIVHLQHTASSVVSFPSWHKYSLAFCCGQSTARGTKGNVKMSGTHSFLRGTYVQGTKTQVK